MPKAREQNALTYWIARAISLVVAGVGLAAYGAVTELTYEPPPPVMVGGVPLQLHPSSGGTALIGIGALCVLVGIAVYWNERRKARSLHPPWAER